MGKSYDALTYTYGRDHKYAAWQVRRNGEAILALPFDMPELVTGAITRTIQAEVDLAVENERK